MDQGLEDDPDKNAQIRTQNRGLSLTSKGTAGECADEGCDESALLENVVIRRETGSGRYGSAKVVR